MPRPDPLYMLDTNIVSALLEPPGSARRELCERRLKALNGDLAISVIVDAETRAGFAKSGSLRKEARYLELKQRLRVAYFDEALAIAEVYAIERAAMLRSGEPLSRLDTFIVAHAIALDATLVSNDRALARVGRLKLQNWLLPEPERKYRASGFAEPAAAYVAAAVTGRGPGALLRDPPAVPWMTRASLARYASAHAH